MVPPSRRIAFGGVARMAVCMPFHALSQISLPSCLVSNVNWIGFDLWCPLLASATNIPHTRSRRRMLACAAHPKKACPATEGGQGPSFVRYAKSYAEVSLSRYCYQILDFLFWGISFALPGQASKPWQLNQASRSI